MSQRDLKVERGKPPEERENAGDQVEIGDILASDWLREWCEFFLTNRGVNQVKTNVTPDFFRHSIEISLIRTILSN